jgi:hypothetical protein
MSRSFNLQLNFALGSAVNKHWGVKGLVMDGYWILVWLMARHYLDDSEWNGHGPRWQLGSAAWEAVVLPQWSERIAATWNMWTCEHVNANHHTSHWNNRIYGLCIIPSIDNQLYLVFQAITVRLKTMQICNQKLFNLYIIYIVQTPSQIGGFFPRFNKATQTSRSQTLNLHKPGIFFILALTLFGDHGIFSQLHTYIYICGFASQSASVQEWWL